MQKEATSNRPSKRTQQQGDRRMVQSSGECEGRAASERAQANAQGGEFRETEEHSVLNRDHASQPPSRAAVETARIESTKGSYEDNPLLSITQPTSAPNNTPVQSPAASPAGGRQAAPGRAGDLRDKGSLVEPSSEHARDRGERALPPPRALLGGGAREVADDGGCVPPRRGSGGHVGAVYRRGSRTEEENSPLSIMNRRQIFSTSDSRSSASGPPAAGASGGDESGDEEIGVAPQSFYFDKDRYVTDPHVKHDQADEKINISSWLRSRHGAEVYSLSDSAGNGKSSENSRQATKDSEQFSIQDGLISPQAPRSALSMGSSCGRVMSRDSVPEEAAAKAEEEDEHYVPPPPSKFINSKLDGVRSRLLLNPRVAPPKIDADMGTATAAAVLSNMRSSPFHFSERSQQYSSRPSSSSFSKSYPRPIIRIHHREHTAGENDESAVLDGDEEDDNAGERDQEDLNGVVKTTGERLRKNSLQAEREVTWNKNGKRINRRLTAASAGNRRPKKPRSSAAKGRSSSSHTDDDGSRVSDDGDESYTNDYHDEDEEDEEDSAARSESKSSRQKAGVGSRSRTGCWICRLRKKKCTEERPSCFNCQRLNLQCHYDAIKPDFVSDPKKKMLKLLEIKTKTKEAKRNAMRKKPSKANS